MSLTGFALTFMGPLGTYLCKWGSVGQKCTPKNSYAAWPLQQSRSGPPLAAVPPQIQLLLCTHELNKWRGATMPHPPKKAML